MSSSAPGHTEGGEVVPVTSYQTEKKNDIDIEAQKAETHHADVENGVAQVEAVQALWGKKGKWLVIAGLAMVMIM